ncbi:hypothetical protein NKG94_50125 [Micromonospora sp. M12]
MAGAALLVTRLPDVPPRPAPVGFKRFAAVRDPRFLAVIGVSAILASHVSIILVTMPLWALNRTDLPHFLIPLLLIVNTAFVILFQVRASRGADTVHGAGRLARRSGYWLAGGCAILAVTALDDNVVLASVAIVAAVLILSVAEVMQAASGWGSRSASPPSTLRASTWGVRPTRDHAEHHRPGGALRPGHRLRLLGMAGHRRRRARRIGADHSGRQPQRCHAGPRDGPGLHDLTPPRPRSISNRRSPEAGPKHAPLSHSDPPSPTHPRSPSGHRGVRCGDAPHRNSHRPAADGVWCLWSHPRSGETGRKGNRRAQSSPTTSRRGEIDSVYPSGWSVSTSRRSRPVAGSQIRTTGST